MAKYASEVDVLSLPCPVCGVAADEACANRHEHWWKRAAVRNAYLTRNRCGMAFGEGVLDEVSEAAARLGMTVPDYIEGAVQARLAAGDPPANPAPGVA